MSELNDRVYAAAQAAWNAQCRLDTLTFLLTEAGEYGGFTAEWVEERCEDFGPIVEGLTEAAGILYAVVADMERE
jgi:hypothetical protein